MGDTPLGKRACLWCHQPIVLPPQPGNAIPAQVAAWRQGYCSQLHEQMDAVREAHEGLAWWQVEARRVPAELPRLTCPTNPPKAQDFEKLQTTVQVERAIREAINAWTAIEADPYDRRKEEARVRVSELRMLLTQFKPWKPA